jgi:CTP:molybdopterin cytidylyltransferase MocA
VINRVLSAIGSAPNARSCLARAAFDGIPGHPVLLGSDHWPGVIKKAVGDRGARDYLKGSRVRLVECADIGSGEDVDLPG